MDCGNRAGKCAVSSAAAPCQWQHRHGATVASGTFTAEARLLPSVLFFLARSLQHCSPFELCLWVHMEHELGNKTDCGNRAGGNVLQVGVHPHQHPFAAAACQVEQSGYLK